MNALPFSGTYNPDTGVITAEFASEEWTRPTETPNRLAWVLCVNDGDTSTITFGIGEPPNELREAKANQNSSVMLESPYGMRDARPVNQAPRP